MTSRAADPLRDQDAIFYELHAKSDADGDADGLGDLKGLTARLDYLERPGGDRIWLLPMYPSPFRDDGYDISDCYGVHPGCGSMENCRELLEQAHARGLRVTTKPVLNHTSDLHQWFIESRSSRDHSAPGRLPGRQRRGAGAQPALAAQLDAAAHPREEVHARVQPWVVRVPASAQPSSAGLRARARRGARPRRPQPVEYRAVGGARSARSRGDDPRGGGRRQPLPGSAPYVLTLGPYGFCRFRLRWL